MDPCYGDERGRSSHPLVESAPCESWRLMLPQPVRQDGEEEEEEEEAAAEPALQPMRKETLISLIKRKMGAVAVVRSKGKI